MADSKLVVLLKLDGTEFGKGISKAQADIAKIGAAFSGVSIAAGAAIKFAADFQDATIKSARSAGVAVASFSSLNYAAKMSGVSTEELSKNLVKLQNPSETAARTFKDLGIKTKDASGKLKDQSTLLAELSDKFAQIENPALKSQAAVRIFGEQGAKMVSMLEGGSKALSEARKEADAFGQIVSEKAGKNAEAFNDNLSKVTMGLTGVRNVVAESAIEFINQSQALEKVQDVLKNVISWWRGLSDNTRETIMQVAAGVAAFGALLLALSAIAAIIPAIAAGFSLLLGPVGLVIAGIGLLAAGVIAYKNANKTALEVAQEQERQAAKNVKALSDTETALLKLASKTKLTSADQAELARIKEDVRKRALAAGQAIDTQTMSMQQLINKTRELRDIEKRNQFAALNKQLIEQAKLYNEAEGRIKVFGESLKNHVMTSEQYDAAIKKTIADMEKYKTAMRDTAVKIQALNSAEEKAVGTALRLTDGKKAQLKSMDAFNSALATYSARNTKSLEAEAIEVEKYQKAYTENFQKIKGAIATAGVVEALANVGNQIIKPFSQLTDTIAKGIEYDSQVALRDLDVVANRAAETYKASREALEMQENEKIKALSDSFDSQIRVLTEGESVKNALAQRFADERLLIANEEYEKAKAAAEQKFKDDLARDQAEYEQKMAVLNERALDREQRQLTESIMEEDARLLRQERERQYQETLAALAKEFAGKQKSIDADLKLTQKANAEKNRAEIEALTNAKNEALTQAEEEKNAKLKALDDARAKEEKAIEKQRLETQYKAQVDAFESTKAVKIAETIASGIAAAAQAFAALAPIPFVGPALGAAAAAVITTATTMRVGQISSQKPIKPAGLLEDGGYIGGTGRHENGTDYNAKVESGEFYLDRGRTAKMLSAIDKGLAGIGGGIVINIQAGAIQGDIRDESTLNKLADKLGQQIQRRMVFA
jgi:hypothetical protein